MKSTLTFDFNNMLAERVRGGLKREDIAAQLERIPAVHAGVTAKRDMNRWRELPYNQAEIIADMKK